MEHEAPLDISLRARGVDGPPWVGTFLSHLEAVEGNIRLAADLTPVSRARVYQVARKRRAFKAAIRRIRDRFADRFAPWRGPRGVQIAREGLVGHGEGDPR